MAKSSRSSSRKENNRRKATTIFGPAELARDARLSAKLLALAKQPKPVASPEVKMDLDVEGTKQADEKTADKEDEMSMDVDGVEDARARVGKRRVEKRKQKKRPGITFSKHGDKVAAKRRKRQQQKEQQQPQQK